MGLGNKQTGNRENFPVSYWLLPTSLLAILFPLPPSSVQPSRGFAPCRGHVFFHFSFSTGFHFVKKKKCLGTEKKKWFPIFYFLFLLPLPVLAYSLRWSLCFERIHIRWHHVTRSCKVYGINCHINSLSVTEIS